MKNLLRWVPRTMVVSATLALAAAVLDFSPAAAFKGCEPECRVSYVCPEDPEDPESWQENCEWEYGDPLPTCWGTLGCTGIKFCSNGCEDN